MSDPPEDRDRNRLEIQDPGPGPEVTGASPPGSEISETESISTDSEFSTDSEDDSDLDQDADESLALTIIQEIEEGVYVCLVCTCEIDRTSQVWSCKSCYRVYDLDCIKDWASRGLSTTTAKCWRCPACSTEHKKLPSEFTCWCGRVKNPRADALIPFSCGSPCNKKYTLCVHSCSAVCHPGKHPECGALGPVMKCRCGKHEQQLPCLATPYETGWSCGEPCDHVVCGMGHKCQQGSCHSGFCDPCKQYVEARCYCGHKKEKVRCAELDPRRCREVDDRSHEFYGAYSCSATVKNFFDCGVHYDEVKCMPLPAERKTCKYAPDRVHTCYCGKMEVSKLQRTSCEDPIPECDAVCGKELVCGCTCLAKCHSGPCECFNIKQAKCSCEMASYLVSCKSLQMGFQPKCHHRCNATLSCKRHLHRQECCAFEQVALSRERENRRNRRDNIRVDYNEQLMAMEPVHICTQPCNRLKECGVHRCEALCHAGKCGVCLESDSTDLVCDCGKTVVPAPVRCGTKLDCQQPCLRRLPCGHKSMVHKCHGDEKNCPNCTEPVTKRCNCGEKEVKNIPCSVKSVSCSKICKEKIECGHPCNRACLKACVDGEHSPVESCQFLCKKVKPSCPHICLQKCHKASGLACDAVICDRPVTISCKCGRMTRKVKCGASKSSSARIGSTYDCDDDCAQELRDKELREAFNTVPDEPTVLYGESITSVYQRQLAWCLKVEATINEFVSNYIDLVASGIETPKFMMFPPMSEPQRKFIHDVAAVYNLYSESQDKAPNRSLFIHITDNTKMADWSIRVELEKAAARERKKQQIEELRQSKLDDALFNAILIQDVFLGCSKEKVATKALEIVGQNALIDEPVVQWIKTLSLVFYDKNYLEMTKELENNLYMLTKSFKKQMRDSLIAFDCKMCLVTEGGDHILKTDSVNVMSELVMQPKDDTTKASNTFAVLLGN